ncbi:hypothetical protein RvY_01420 [Ramazzottius varieornatus]|uniref:Uncharacterized protein n=1 Tax=Ramazzottius varieornatus TaxID=947166 RepID=A0A1D1UK66_RAMVA|nr:hypothetical protein RvY_01420 [Ramazzottius varieornatus]
MALRRCWYHMPVRGTGIPALKRRLVAGSSSKSDGRSPDSRFRYMDPIQAKLQCDAVSKTRVHTTATPRAISSLAENQAQRYKKTRQKKESIGTKFIVRFEGFFGEFPGGYKSPLDGVTASFMIEMEGSSNKQSIDRPLYPLGGTLSIQD